MILHTWRPLGLYTFISSYFFKHFISSYYSCSFVTQRMCCKEEARDIFIFNMLGMYFWWRGMNWQKNSPREMWKIKCHFRSFHLSCPYYFFGFFSFKGFHRNSFHSLQAFNYTMLSTICLLNRNISPNSSGIRNSNENPEQIKISTFSSLFCSFTQSLPHSLSPPTLLITWFYLWGFFSCLLLLLLGELKLL